METGPGIPLLALVWGIAIAGIIINALWINCPKWFSSLIYIAMGWVCVLAIRQIILALPRAAFGWLLAGGIIYTVGGVIYALKLPIFNSRHRSISAHMRIFHLFVMGGSFCHYIMMYAFVASGNPRLFRHFPPAWLFGRSKHSQLFKCFIDL